jgi:nucleotide-binding universal stress UspA family protein
MTIRSIVCPTDFSDASRHAMDHAVAMARWCSARIVVLHAHHAVSAADSALFNAGGGGPHLESEVLVAERSELAAAVDSMRAGGVAVEGEIVSGPPAETITAFAASTSADLIVIGTQGAGGFKHLVVGSVTETVLRRARCPVLTVPPGAQSTSTLPFKRILCPTDFSESSLAGLRLAVSFAQQGEATLTLMHVIDDPDENELFVARRYDVHHHRALREQHALDQLRTLAPDVAHDWALKLRVAQGNAYDQILEVAAQERVDLIVVGVQGRKPMDLMLFGSTTNQIVRRATCPVLTVRQ